MTDHPEIDPAASPEPTPVYRRRSAGRFVTQLAVELGLGLCLAAVVVVVAWASSNAIRFVYGGY